MRVTLFFVRVLNRGDRQEEVEGVVEQGLKPYFS